MKFSRPTYRFICMLGVVVFPTTVYLVAQIPTVLKNSAGVELSVDTRNSQPALRIVVPGESTTESAIQVIFPEHVTAMKHGETEGAHLYLYRPGNESAPPTWQHTGQSFQYEREFKDGVHFLARATLQDDGVLFHYEFHNGGSSAYDMIYAVTDPRMAAPFHDVRLERTYVHLPSGFELLASETPERLTMPVKDWLPARYLASYTWPVPAQLVEHRDDGIMYYNKSRAVDEPMVATLSEDKQWVVSSFTHTTGNVWSNPELTCQHVDPQTSLAVGQTAILEVKILVLKGSLDQALKKVIAQRASLK